MPQSASLITLLITRITSTVAFQSQPRIADMQFWGLISNYPAGDPEEITVLGYKRARISEE